MAYFDTTWYCNAGDQSTTGYYAVAKRPQNTAVAAGAIRRQFTAPAVGSERCYICTVAGTTANTTDATWLTTRGGVVTDGTVTWRECTGQASINGDATNTLTWSAFKALGNPSIGAIIKRNNGASYQYCTSAGSFGTTEPAAFSDTAGVTASESGAGGSAAWVSLGPVSNFTGGQAPHARMNNACTSTWFAAGNTVYVAANHAETYASGSVTIAPPGSATTIGRIICHNQAGSYPPAAGDITTGATNTMAANSTLGFNLSTASMYVYGIAFIASTSSGNIMLSMTSSWCYFDNCVFKVTATGAAGVAIALNAASVGVVIWNNCTANFGNANQSIDPGNVDFTWRNTGQILVGGSTVPTDLFKQSTSARFMSIVLEALDLSQISTNLFDAATAATVQMGTCLIKDCKLHASMVQETPTNPGKTIQFVRSSA